MLPYFKVIKSVLIMISISEVVWRWNKANLFYKTGCKSDALGEKITFSCL